MGNESNSGREELFEATASESQARAEAALPSQGSEGVSHLLHSFREENLSRPPFGQDRDYMPSSKVDWVVHVEFPATVVLRKTDIVSVFNVEWLNQNDRPTVFGFSPESQRWTFVGAAGVPDRYTRLQIAWRMRPFDKDEPITEQRFEQYEVAVERAASKLKATGVQTELSPIEAEKRSAVLIELAASWDQEMGVVLQAPKGQTFDGRGIWDVMLCLGLQWGDMDLFHWENPGIPGNDHLFSVWTSTPPGYFFPERIAADLVQTADLVFGFSIARTYQPETMFDSMMQAVRYAQKRLGGNLVFVDGSPFSEDAARSQIHNVVKELKAAGFEPGTDDTLYLI